MILKKSYLLLIMLFSFFLFKIDASALDCYYGDGSIKIFVDIEGCEGGSCLTGELYENENSTNISFYPINSIVINRVWFNSSIYYGGSTYIKEGTTSGIAACPSSIKTYYRQNSQAFKTYLYNVGGLGLENMPIIEFSEVGVYQENGSIETVVLQKHLNNTSLYDYCIANNSSESLCRDNLKSTNDNSANFSYKEYSLNQNKTFKQNEQPTGEYRECSYKNSNNLPLTFKFYKDGTSEYTVNGETKKAYNTEGKNFYSACPGVVWFGLGLWDNPSNFTVKQSCEVEDEYCFYQEGIDPTYSGNASAVHHYIHSLNTGNKIEVKVLKIPDQTTGKSYQILLNNQDITNQVTNASTDPNSMPYILKSGNTYTFSNVLDGSYEEAYIYITKIHDIVLGGSGTLEKTCDNILGNDFIDFLNNNVFKIVYIAIPVLLIILTSFDLAKLVFNDEKEGIPGALKRFRNRVIAAFLIFLIPNIIILIADTLQATEVKQCVEALQSVANK